MASICMCVCVCVCVYRERDRIYLFHLSLTVYTLVYIIKFWKTLNLVDEVDVSGVVQWN
jgi:hypothetical protein